MKKYAIGIDYGTLSARTVIADIETGEEIAASVYEYAHGVMSATFTDGTPLPPDYALQHPKDYIDALFCTIKDCLEKSAINPADITGVGVDFTASTILPVDKNGEPLCFKEEFKNNPHAYVKLWKHHAAQKEADDINRLLKEYDNELLQKYGGTISCEWLFPKVLQILREDENTYNNTARFIEAGDFIVQVLTGKESCSVCGAGFKGMWDETKGYPDKAFLKALDPRLENIIGDKIKTEVSKLSETAGYITEEIEKITGLKAGTPVKPAIIDAHAALPALGITSPGDLLMIIGTSTCHILLSDKKSFVPGISGYVKDGIVDDLYAFEAGQSCVGDSFDWFIKNCVPHTYYMQAEENGINIHKYLRQKAEKLAPGANGLLALDWWNGNRTPYVDGNLSGMLLGLDLSTTPEEIYRALIEATAYGTRRIIEIYEQNGIEIKTLYAAGGIAEKDPFLMQIYADVTGREIFISGTAQACAYGSAVIGAVNENGYGTLQEASAVMRKIKSFSYQPNKDNHEKYTPLYEQYKILSEHFAKEDVMKILKGGNCQ